MELLQNEHEWREQLYISKLYLDPPLNLLIAASAGPNSACVVMLIEQVLSNGFDLARILGTTGRHKRTPLMVAAVVDAPLEVFVQLLEAGADTNHRDLGGFSALAWVVEKITELPSADKDPRGPTYRNEIVQLLIKFSADVNGTSLCKGPGLCDDECKTGCTKTPLHLALESSTDDGLLAVCQTLLKSGAALDSLVAVRAHDPNTLIEICKRRGHSHFQLELIKLTYRTDHEFMGERLANFDDPSSDGTHNAPLL
jgi:ankyrin repeat protein